MNMNGRAFITLAHTTGACLTSQAPYKNDDIITIEVVLVADICLCKRCRGESVCVCEGVRV